MTRQPTTSSHFFRAILSFAVIALIMLVLPVFSSSSPDLGALENIHGIAFPVPPPAGGGDRGGGSVTVTEKLAHADIYLDHSVLAKQLKLTITFTPLDTQELSVGIRENSFWLSYPKIKLYKIGSGKTSRGKTPGVNAKTPGVEERVIFIPLTDKLADSDGSIDLMFFASNQDDQSAEYEGVADTTLWQLHDIQAEVSPVIPTKPQLKDFLRSKLNREQVL